MVSRIVFMGFAFLIAASAHADDGVVYSVDSHASKITYTLVHKAHTVVGVAKKDIDGKVKLSKGDAQLMVRVPVASFDSENSNRDTHMQEAVEASKHPNVELKAVADGVAPGKNGKAVLKGKLTFHGISHPVEIPVDVIWNGKTATVVGQFSISLDAYKVERPSLLFVKVEDKLDLAVDLTISE